jgi:hypothetical protein
MKMSFTKICDYSSSAFLANGPRPVTGRDPATIPAPGFAVLVPPCDPPSMGKTGRIRHGRCIAVRVMPFACRADVRPGIFNTEDARGPRSATEKSAHVTRGGVADRCHIPMALPLPNLRGAQWSSVCLRAKIEERINESRDLHVPSCRETMHLQPRGQSGRSRSWHDGKYLRPSAKAALMAAYPTPSHERRTG